MTERRIQEIKAEIIGKSQDTVDSIFAREGFVDLYGEQYKGGERGYDVTYYRRHSGYFTVGFDDETICQVVYYQY